MKMSGASNTLLMTGGRFTRLVVVPLLLPGTGSVVALAAVAVFVMVVPPGVELLILTTSVKATIAEFATLVFVKTTVPVPPTGGEVVVHPAGAVAETKVVLAGVGSATVTLLASLGPLFLRLIVYVMF